MGNYLLKALAKKFPKIECIGLSRSGKVRHGELDTDLYNNVKFVSANVLHRNTFENLLVDADAVVHSIGTLLEGKTPESSYEAMNRDSCTNVAGVL